MLCASSAAVTLRTAVQLTYTRRTLFSLPDLSSFVPNISSQPQRYHERKTLPYTQKELYDVVADVSSYPRFVPFCTGSRVLTRNPNATGNGQTALEAELTVGFLNFEESYVSTVTCNPNASVEAVASSATPLFKALSTTWRFEPTTQPSIPIPAKEDSQSTLVSLDLVYAFANPLHASVSSTFFGQVSKLMVQAFEERCRQVYGSRRNSIP